MPKIREKFNLLVDGEYRKKSGILTRSLKSVKKHEDASRQNYFDCEVFHDRYQRVVEARPYNDENTISFVEKNVNPTFSVEDKYKQDNKLLHSPSEFNTTQTVLRLTEAEHYSKFIVPNFFDGTQQIFVQETSCVDKDNLSAESEVITVNLDFNDPCKLCFNLKDDDPSSQEVVIDGQTYKAQNSPIAYFNFTDRQWEYLGNTQQNYYNTIDDFIESPIAFNSISTKNSYEIKNQQLGYPVNTFGFPFDDRFQGMNRHLYSLSNHIIKPFVLEKVKVKFIATSLSETEIANAYEILNSLNFFILNQRGNLNKDSFVNLSANQGSFNYFKPNDDPVIDNSGIFSKQISYTVDQTPVFTLLTDPGGSSETTSVVTGSTGNIGYDENNSSQRELVSYVTLVNYSSGSQQSSNIDLDSIKLNADLFYENTSSNFDPNNSNECNYYNREFTIIGDCRTPVYHDEIEKISSFDIYPNVKLRNRSGTVYKTERSIEADYSSKTDIETYTDVYNKDLSISSLSYKNNPYTLHPSDKLIFGFSFNTSMDFIENSNFAKDIMFLHDKIEISLIGKYYRKNSGTRYNKNNFIQNNVKKVNYYNSINVTDSLGLSNIYLNKGAYYDLTLHIPSITLPTIPPTVTPAIDIPDVLSGVYFNRSRTFLNYERLNSNTEYLVDRVVAEKPIYRSSMFSLRSFGMPSCLLNDFKFYAYINQDNKYFFGINKRNRNIYFEPLSAGTVNTYNTDSQARITYPAPFVE
jgi:hypothetical protein